MVAELTAPASKYDIETRFSQLQESWFDFPDLNQIQEQLTKLVNNNFVHKQFLDIIPIIGNIDKKRYHQFLKRKNDYLEKHETLSREDFCKLFWDQRKSAKNKWNYSTWKYNKSNFHQWWTGECVLVSSLETLKKTIFFETMIRCSLKRNDDDDWWILLIPLCNNEWQYREVKDDEIKYLKEKSFTYFNIPRGVISDSSLWFNILESIFLKEYLHNVHNLVFDKINELDYNTISQKIEDEDWDWIQVVGEWGVLDMFLWEEIIRLSKETLPPPKNKWKSECNTISEECLNYILELSKTWTIKLLCTVKIPNNYYTDKIKDTEQIQSTRWYTIKKYKEDDNFHYGIYNTIDWKLWRCFSPKWCDEWFFTRHKYSIERTFVKNGEIYVVIINPWFTEKKLTVTLKQFKEMVKSLDVVVFDIDKIFVEK